MPSSSSIPNAIINASCICRSATIFQWDSVRSLEVALYRTYCVPSISKLLDRTREFYDTTQRRYDDTSIMVAELCELRPLDVHLRRERA